MKFYIRDVHHSSTMMNYIEENSNYLELIDSVKPKLVSESAKYLTFKNKDIDTTAILSSVEEAIDLYGSFGWRSQNVIGKTIENQSYKGISLTFNPQHTDIEKPHQSSLGSGLIYNFSNYVFEGVPNKRNSYLDSLSFNYRTEASKHGALGRFIDTAKRTLIRSRVAVIDSSYFKDETFAIANWHYDEKIFENLRLNIPLETSPEFQFQLKGDQPYHLEVGKSYTWNTNIQHRVFATQPTGNKRVHLVLGFSPWLDFNYEDQCWETNEFWGVKHPFDMLIDGDIIPGITFEAFSE